MENNLTALLVSDTNSVTTQSDDDVMSLSDEEEVTDNEGDGGENESDSDASEDSNDVGDDDGCEVNSDNRGIKEKGQRQKSTKQVIGENENKNSLYS